MTRPGRRVTVAAVLGALALISAVVVWAVWVRPWTAWPDIPVDTIELQWSQLEAEVLRKVEPSPFWDQVGEFPRQELDVGALLGVTESDPWPLVDVPPGAEPHIAGLVRWAEEDGRGFETCARFNALAAFELGRLTLATATAQELPQARATLRLALALRRSRTILESTVGVSLTGDVAAWAHARNVEPWPELREATPDAQELRAAAGRDAICLLRMASAARLGQPYLPGKPPWYQRVGLSMHREIAHFKSYHLGLQQQMLKAGDTLADIKRACPYPTDEQMPKSMLVRLGAVSIARVAGQWDRAAKRFRQHVPEQFR